MTFEEQEEWCVFCRVLLLCLGGKSDIIEHVIPSITILCCHLANALRESLMIGPVIQAIGLWMVCRCNWMLDAKRSAQLPLPVQHCWSYKYACHRAKFHADWSSCCRDKPNFPFFKMETVRHLGLLKTRNFNFQAGWEAQYASSCQILHRSVKLLQRYDHFSIFPRVWLKMHIHAPFWVVYSLQTWLL